MRMTATAKTARIGSFPVRPPLRCVSTASLTIVVRGVQLPFRAGTDLLAVGELRSTTSSPQGPRDSSDIPKRYTGARDTTFALVAQEIIGFLSVTDTYIQTISVMRRRISCPR